MNAGIAATLLVTGLWDDLVERISSRLVHWVRQLVAEELAHQELERLRRSTPGLGRVVSTSPASAEERPGPSEEADPATQILR